MLESDDRRLLLDALRPPPGYSLDHLVTTTYSLDLLTLLAAPLAFTFLEWEDEDGRPTADPLSLLEALRRHAQRLTVFCQAGEIAVPPHDRQLYVHLEESVVPVTPPRTGGVFHPKVWVMRYRTEGGQARYRLVCLSRNLTGDRSWDTLLSLEGHPTPRGGLAPNSAPVGEFLRALPAMAVQPMEAEARSAVERVAEDVERVEFRPPDGFDGLRFWPLGMGKRRPWPFEGRLSRLLVVSPFVTAPCLRRFEPEDGVHLLVSRPDELERVGRRALATFDRVCSLDEAAKPEPEDGATLEPAAPPTPSQADGVLRGLHAKLYVADDGWRARLWTGSANATTAAFDKNVEFLVELRGLRSSCGVAEILGEGSENEQALVNLLADVPLADEPVAEDPQAALEHRTDALVHELASGTFLARVVAVEAPFTVELSSSPPASLPPGATARAWPITQRPEHAAVPLSPGADPVATFANLSLEAVTSFFAVEIELIEGELSVTRRFVVNATLENAPPGRREAILRALLSDPDRVLRYLRLLLAEASTDGMLPAPPADGSSGSQWAGGWALGDVPILDALVRALEADPAKIDLVARLVEELDDATGAGASLLPPGFHEIWAPIWVTRQQMSVEGQGPRR